MNKERKSKVLIVILILLFGTIFNLYFSTMIHQILSKEMGQVVIPNIRICINSLRINKNHLSLFSVFQLIIVLGSVLFFATNNKPYQSELIKITPNISTPASAGQKQFGSARWMTNEEKGKAFPSCTLKGNDKLIHYLIKHGYDDMETEEVGENSI